MPKRNKCEHGNKTIRFDGCAECVTTAFGAFKVVRSARVTPAELLFILKSTFKDQAAWDAAVAQARKEIAELEAKEGSEDGR
jgi:hypothetical protein